MRAAKTTAEDQASEITRLKAALLSYQTTGDDERGIKDSKMGMKAQISALKAQTDEQTATIQRLRAELAATNERMARQATHFRDEMRRLAPARCRPQPAQRRSAPSTLKPAAR